MARANASSVSTCAMTARRPSGTPRSHGASAAEYSRWRAFSRPVRRMTPGQANPLATYPTAANWAAPPNTSVLIAIASIGEKPASRAAMP